MAISAYRIKHYDSVAHFESKVSARCGIGGCWEWDGPLNGGGYGVFKPRGGKQYLAHRWSYGRHDGLGSLDEATCVMHICYNRRCVNPYHLKGGTISDNNKDMARKGRANRDLSKALATRLERHGY